MFFRVAPYMRKVVQRSGRNSRQLGSANGEIWTRCGHRPGSGERDSPTGVRGIGAMLVQWMGMALRPGSARLAVRCRRCGRRRRRRGRDRAGAGNCRAALLRTAARLLLRPARLLLLRAAGLLLWTTGEPLTPVEADLFAAAA